MRPFLNLFISVSFRAVGVGLQSRARRVGATSSFSALLLCPCLSSISSLSLYNAGVRKGATALLLIV